MNDDLFVAISWPQTQDLQELDGFYENATLINEGPLYDIYGPLSFMVRKSWLDSLQ